MIVKKYFEVEENDDGKYCLVKYTGTDTKVEIPEGIVSIGDYVLDEADFVEEVIIPEGTLYIEDNAFSDCESLKKVTLPESLREINMEAFCNCNQLENINLPKNLKIIGAGAFSDCDSLTDIKIPSSLIEIQLDSFDDTLGLLEQNPDYQKIDGIMYNTKTHSALFSLDSDAKTMKIADGTLYIASNAFSFCQALNSVELPESLAYIGREAFSFCASLKKIYIPKSVKVIDSSAFNKCVALSQVTFDEKCTTRIAEQAFSQCQSLERVEIPAETVAYEGAFDEDCETIYLENEDGKMVYNDECLLGESLKIYVVDGEIEQKEAIRLLSSGKEESFNFVHINYYENDYWTRDIFITNNKDLIPGIITTDTLTYSAADGTTATSKKLEEGTVVAIDPVSKQTDSDLGIDFLSVTYYSGTAFGKTAFVKMDSLSDYPGDIIAKQTISRILANESIKPEIADILFENLEAIPTSDYMSQKIEEAKIQESDRRK